MRTNISVIIPIFEQWQFVPELLECLAAQSYAMESVEVLLVDNGSKKFCVPEMIPSNVKILYCETPGAYAARNFGIRHSRGDWIVFTDADCLPSEGWLAGIVNAVASCRLGNFFVAGSIEAVCGIKDPSAYEIYDIVRGIPQEHYVQRGYAATANLAVPRKLIESIGDFNEFLYSGGDADFCRRSGKCGFKLIYAQSALVRHRTRSSWELIATKARRVKGGQLVCKSKIYKVWIFIRTSLSPIVTIFRFIKGSHFPMKYRLVASLIYFRVWGVEVSELIRVFFGGEPERR